MPDFEYARKTMVDNQLRTSGVTDRRLLLALGEVPREKFVPAGRAALAYVDIVHPLGGGRALGAPAPIAKLLQLAAIAHTDTVLDVGVGSGYSTAVLAQLAATVVGLESDPALAAKARETLAAIGIANATIIEAALDGTAGVGGPFDVIVVEGMLDAAPEALFSHLKAGGRLVAIIRGAGPAVAHIFVKSGEGITARADFDASLPRQPAPPKAVEFVF